MKAKKRTLRVLLAAFLIAAFVITACPVSSNAWYYDDRPTNTGIDKFDAFATNKNWKNGAPWGNDKPKISRSGASGCAAYCADFTKYCYGIDGITSKDSYKDASQIRAGDIVHLQGESYGHWIVVFKREGNELLTGDGNWGGIARVGWNYWIQNGDVYGSQHHFDVGYHFLPKLNKTGKWVKESGRWRYQYTNTLYARYAWIKSGSKWYYIAKKFMATGWKKIDGKKYYFNKSGAMVTGWKKIDGVKYYFNPKNGAMTTSWKKIDGNKYFFNKTGAMVTGWWKVGSKKYFFNTKGIMITGWKKIQGKYYYFNQKGVMVTGTKTIDGETYTFDKNGVWIK